MTDEDPTADWWCDNCQTDDHPTDSTLCKHMTDEQRASMEKILNGPNPPRWNRKHGFPRLDG